MANRPISPAEPTKRHPPAVAIRPNAHPYAIKTTSSALLSRSNSSPHSAQHTRHHYVPSSPTRVRHRHSSSLSSELEGGVIPAPSPLPTPPSFTAPLPVNGVEEPTLRRTRRAETMPSGATNPIIDLSIRNHTRNDNTYQHDHGYEHDLRTDPYAGLPPNPKQWNTDELTTYLQSSLRLHNHDTHEDKDYLNHTGILECVRARGLTGRELLRLTDADLASTPLSDVQRAQLLEHSRTLRADVLRGRISVDSYHSREVSDRSNDIYSRSLRSSSPFLTNFSSSISVDDLRLSHVSGEDGNEALFPPSPAMSLHRSNSVSDASAQRYRDLARMRVRRRGRVKGLVETWERTSTSGSECSASEGSMSGSEAELESETDPESESNSDPKQELELQSDLKSTLHTDAPNSNEADSPTAGGTIVLHHPPSLPPPPPYTHAYAARTGAGAEEEEPSIEELLASSSDAPLMGGRAWEADFGLGETVKRVPVAPASTCVDVNGASSSATPEPDTSRGSNEVPIQTREDSVRSKRFGTRASTGSRRKSSRSQKRVVTAIFTGSSPVDVPGTAGGDMGFVASEVPLGSGAQSDSDAALRALEESLAATRAQLEVLRMRLEAVEADTARQEAELRQDHQSRSHSSETRRRRAPANETVINDEIYLPPEGPRREPTNRNVNEGLDGMSLGDIVRALVARAMGWAFPYAHPGTRGRMAQSRSLGSRSSSNDGSRSPARRRTHLPAVRVSYIIWISFAICAAVLRRVGFGRWIRRG